MIRKLRRRATEPEWMDDERAGGEELRQAYRHLRRLNRLLGAASPVRYGVERLWKRAGRPKRLTILDIGAGSGDVNRALLRWADRKGVALEIVAVDRSSDACREAEEMYRDEPRVSVRQADLFSLEDRCADIVTASQFLHHFATEHLTLVVAKMVSASRIGVVIQDIHRHVVPWATVWLITRLISRNRYIRHDGPLSVAKGFRKADWEGLRQHLRANLIAHDAEVSWRPLFRYAVIIPKDIGDAVT